MRVYQKFPAAFKSDHWSEIVRLANAGDMKAAEFLASEHQDRSRATRAQNVIARRIRLQRVQLIRTQRIHIQKVKDAFEIAASAMANRMIHLPNNVSAIAPMRQRVREIIIDLRRSLTVILTDLVWKSILLGVQNMGEALKPILRDNAESLKEELHDVNLLEARLTMGMDKAFSRRNKATVNLGSEKWERIVDRIYADIVRSNNAGLSLSEKIWDLTNRAEQDIKRILASDIAAGNSSREIADRINKYVFTSGIDQDYQSGPGIYRSPLKNALRVARTETNRAYTKASAAWATNKAWVQGIMPTLSAAHKVEDDCDDVVANAPDGGYSPEVFASLIPVHPHCMCFGTYVIDEKYLTGEPGTAEGDSDE